MSLRLRNDAVKCIFSYRCISEKFFLSKAIDRVKNRNSLNCLSLISVSKRRLSSPVS